MASVAAIAASVTLLSGCLPQPSHPNFGLPVAWTGDVGLLLRADGTAQLNNVPNGQWTQTPDGICWNTTGGRYSGEATWRVYSPRGVEVRFGESDVIFWAEPGYFGSYSWRSIEVVTCDGDFWAMGLECGTVDFAAEADCGIEGRRP